MVIFTTTLSFYLCRFRIIMHTSHERNTQHGTRSMQYAIPNTQRAAHSANTPTHTRAHWNENKTNIRRETQFVGVG